MFLWFGSKEYTELVELVNNTRRSLDELLERKECECGVRLLDSLEILDYNQNYEKRLIEYQDNFNNLLHRVTSLEIMVNQKINEIDNSLLIRFL